MRVLRDDDGLNRFTSVIGISAFPEEVDALRATFDAYGTLILKFDVNGGWKSGLRGLASEVAERTKAIVELDFLVVCALEEERAGFASTSFLETSTAVVEGLNVHYGRIGDRFGAIIRLSRIGLVTATREVTVALGTFRPKVLCMSGICAGISSKVELGQLVVASPTWEYQAGKWSKNGFEIAPDQVPLRPATRPTIDLEISRDDFLGGLEVDLPDGIDRPKRKFKPILAPFATGSAVIADASRLHHIIQQHRKIAALDMEAYGLYYAAHESRNAVKHYFVVKTVVDLADKKKSDDLHAYGSIVSARAAEKLIAILLA